MDEWKQYTNIQKILLLTTKEVQVRQKKQSWPLCARIKFHCNEIVWLTSTCREGRGPKGGVGTGIAWHVFTAVKFKACVTRVPTPWQILGRPCTKSISIGKGRWRIAVANWCTKCCPMWILTKWRVIEESELIQVRNIRSKQLNISPQHASPKQTLNQVTKSIFRNQKVTVISTMVTAMSFVSQLSLSEVTSTVTAVIVRGDNKCVMFIARDSLAQVGKGELQELRLQVTVPLPWSS